MSEARVGLFYKNFAAWKEYLTSDLAWPHSPIQII